MLKKFFIPKRESITVVLNGDAIIVDIKSDIRELQFKKEDMIGKNWFDIFIETTDRDKVMGVFNGLLSGEPTKWNTYQNDIKSQNGKHLFLDFENEVITKNEKTLIISKGYLHYENKTF